MPKVFPPKLGRQLSWAEQDCFRALKDEFGASHVRVRGPAKVMAHLAFGLLALTLDQWLKLAGWVRI